jgi:hypothetical protein
LRFAAGSPELLISSVEERLGGPVVGHSGQRSSSSFSVSAIGDGGDQGPSDYVARTLL